MADTFLFMKLVDFDADYGYGEDSEGMVWGESDNAQFLYQIELESVGWSMARVPNEAANPNQRPTSTREAKALEITKYYDASSAQFNYHLHSGKPFQSALISYTVVASSGATGEGSDDAMLQVPAVTIELTWPRVVSVTVESAEGGRSVALKETIKLAYDAFRLSYFPPSEYDPSGKANLQADVDTGEMPEVVTGGLRQAPKTFDAPRCPYSSES